MTDPANRNAIRNGVFLIIGLLVLILFLGGTYISYVVRAPYGSVQYQFFGRLLYWLLLLAAWHYSIRVERQPLLVWPEQRHNFWFYPLSVIGLAAAVWISLVVVQTTIYAFLHANESSRVLKEMVSVYKTSPWLGVFTAITAGVTEELIFRGYLLPRLAMLLNSPAKAIWWTTLIFGLAHFGYGTIINVAFPFILGFAQAFHYWKFRNIKVLILFHILWDLLVIFAAVKSA